MSKGDLLSLRDEYTRRLLTADERIANLESQVRALTVRVADLEALMRPAARAGTRKVA